MNIEFEKAAGCLNAEQMTSLARTLVLELEGRRVGRYADMPPEDAASRAENEEGAGYSEELRRVNETLERIVQIQAAAFPPLIQAQASDRETLSGPGASGIQSRWRAGESGAGGYRVYAGGEAVDGVTGETVYRTHSSVTNRDTLEAGRMSDYFRRDSRRYDGGFERF